MKNIRSCHKFKITHKWILHLFTKNSFPVTEFPVKLLTFFPADSCRNFRFSAPLRNPIRGKNIKKGGIPSHISHGNTIYNVIYSVMTDDIRTHDARFVSSVQNRPAQFFEIGRASCREREWRSQVCEA